MCQAQEAVWCLECTEQRSQQLLNVLERGVKSTDLLGRAEANKQRLKCLLSGPRGCGRPLPALALGYTGHKAGEDNLERHWEGILQENLAGHCPAMRPGQVT